MTTEKWFEFDDEYTHVTVSFERGFDGRNLKVHEDHLEKCIRNAKHLHYFSHLEILLRKDDKKVAGQLAAGGAETEYLKEGRFVVSLYPVLFRSYDLNGIRKILTHEFTHFRSLLTRYYRLRLARARREASQAKTSGDKLINMLDIFCMKLHLEGLARYFEVRDEGTDIYSESYVLHLFSIAHKAAKTVLASWEELKKAENYLKHAGEYDRIKAVKLVGQQTRKFLDLLETTVYPIGEYMAVLLSIGGIKEDSMFEITEEHFLDTYAIFSELKHIHALISWDRPSEIVLSRMATEMRLLPQNP